MTDPLYRRVEAFFESLVMAGVCGAVLSPGSRSTPLTVSAHRTQGLPTWVVLDERSAGFMALGMARMTNRPAVLVCTSGTAVANYLPAIVEAHHSGVPLIVCSADRPPELREWGAGQTITQNGIYGSTVRWSAELPVPPDGEIAYFSAVAERAVASATGGRPGPVHLNWPFREPFDPVDLGPATEGAKQVVSPRGEPSPSPQSLVVDAEIERLRELVSTHERGMFAVGPLDEPALASAVSGLAQRAGWPVIADPASQLRCGPFATTTPIVAAADVLLKVELLAARTKPDVVVRIGDALTSKPFRLWLEHHQPDHVVLIDPHGVWHDPSFATTEHFRSNPAELLSSVAASLDVDRASSWISMWREAESVAQEVLDRELGATESPLLEASIARTIGRELASGATVVVANSMPVRDVDSFLSPRADPLRVLANRGASGIDGLVSMTAGVAAIDVDPVVLYAGDLTVLHDVGALFVFERLGLHATVIVPDNNGGGIFSFLPIADRIPSDEFETLFHTPTGFDLTALDGVGGVRVTSIGALGDLEAAVRKIGRDPTPGVDLLHVPIDRTANVDQHRRLTALVADALAVAARA